MPFQAANLQLTTTAQTNAPSGYYGSMAYSPTLGLFANVTSAGVVSTSPDGIIWTNQTTLASNTWHVLGWAGNKFVAFGDNGALATSADGITWTAQAALPGAPSFLGGFAWCPETSTGVVFSQNYIASTSDGLTYTQQTAPTYSNGYRDFIGVNPSGNFLIVSATSADNAWRSADGLSWSTVALPAADKFGDPVWDGTSFVVPASVNNNALRSADGLTFTTTPGPGWYANPRLRFAAYGNHIVGTDGAGIYASDDNGATWSVYPPAQGGGTKVLTDGTAFYVIGNGYVTTVAALAAAQVTSASPLGFSVVAPSNSSYSFPRGVAWSPTLKRFASVTTAGYFESSPDGLEWTNHNNVDGFYYRGLFWQGGRFIALADGGVGAVSTDGITWTAQAISNGAQPAFTPVYGDRFVAVGQSSGWSGYSTDGITWTAGGTIPSSGYNWNGIAYSPTLNRYVATSSANPIGFVLVSSDSGATWQQQALPTARQLTGVAWDGAMFVAISFDGSIVRSADGLTWTELQPAGLLTDVNTGLLLVCNGVIFAKSSASLYVTADHGSTWYGYNSSAYNSSETNAYTDGVSAFFADNSQTIQISGASTGTPDAGVQYATLANTAKLTLPAPTLEATGTKVLFGAKGKLPILRLSATGSAQTPNGVAAGLPTLALAARGGATARGTLPSLSLLATGTGVVIGRVKAPLPALSLSAHGLTGGVGGVRGKLPGLRLAARGGATARGILPTLSLLAGGLGGAIGRSKGVLPGLTLAAGAHREAYGGVTAALPSLRMVPSARAVLTLPALALLATGSPVVVVDYEAYAVNLKRDPNLPGNVPQGYEVTHYTTYPFDRIVRFGDTYYGVGADGIFELTGDTDDGAPIAWAFRTAKTDFGTLQMKRLVSGYLGGRLVSEMTVTIAVGEASEQAYTYTTVRSAAAQNYKVRFGRGLRARYYAVEMADAAGKYIEVDAVDLEVDVLERAI